MKHVDIYTDGSCSGNPGPGGWAAILRYGEHTKEINGSENDATNNRMELLAVIKALEALKEPCDVSIHSDSAYVVNAFAQGWIERWQRSCWLTAGKKPVENRDLWEVLLSAKSKHQVTFVKVLGHADCELNNRCDSLAKSATRQVCKPASYEPVVRCRHGLLLEALQSAAGWYIGTITKEGPNCRITGYYATKEAAWNAFNVGDTRIAEENIHCSKGKGCF